MTGAELKAQFAKIGIEKNQAKVFVKWANQNGFDVAASYKTAMSKHLNIVGQLSPVAHTPGRQVADLQDTI
jgi:hypothetical protein